MGFRNKNICRKSPSGDAKVDQTVSFWGGEQRLRCWASWLWPLGHDLSLRHDLVTPLLRVICTHKPSMWAPDWSARQPGFSEEDPAQRGPAHQKVVFQSVLGAAASSRYQTIQNQRQTVFCPAPTLSIERSQCAPQWTRDPLFYLLRRYLI